MSRRSVVVRDTVAAIAAIPGSSEIVFAARLHTPEGIRSPIHPIF